MVFSKEETFYDKHRQTLIGERQNLNTMKGCVDFYRQALLKSIDYLRSFCNEIFQSI